MKRTTILPLLIAVAAAFLPRAAGAGPIVLLSGDSNMADALDGSLGAPIDAGNQRFFLNILQGGTNVLVQGGGGGFPGSVFANAINNFYGASGIVSNLISSPPTDQNLAQANLFIDILPAPLSAAEINSLTTFLNDGGSVFFLGDNSGLAASENVAINNALLALGSNLAIDNQSVGCVSLFHTLSGNEIGQDPLTQGVSTFTCAAGAAVFSRNPQGFGSVPLFTEANGSHAVIYEPFGTPDTNPPVPEPASLLLLSTGGFFCWIAWRRKTRVLDR